MQCEIPQLAIVTEKYYSSDSAALIRKPNSDIKYANYKIARIKLPRLIHQSIRMVGYSHADYVNNHKNTAQLGKILLLKVYLFLSPSKVMVRAQLL